MNDEDQERLMEIIENFHAGVYDENVWTKEDINFLLLNLPRWMGESYNFGFDTGIKNPE